MSSNSDALRAKAACPCCGSAPVWAVEEGKYYELGCRTKECEERPWVASDDKDKTERLWEDWCEEIID